MGNKGKAENKDKAIHVCGDPSTPNPFGWERAETNCEACGDPVVYRPDPEVPNDAIHVCFGCAMKMMEEHGAPIIAITKQNQEAINQLGYEITPHEGNC